MLGPFIKGVTGASGLACREGASSSFVFVRQRLEAAEFGRRALQQWTRSWNVQEADRCQCCQNKNFPRVQKESQFVAAQKDVGLAGVKPWKQRPVLHTHCEQGEVGLQSTLISALWANLSELSIPVVYLKQNKTLLISESFWFLQNSLYIWYVLLNILAGLGSRHNYWVTIAAFAVTRQRQGTPESGSADLSCTLLSGEELPLGWVCFSFTPFIKRDWRQGPLFRSVLPQAMLSDSIGMISIAVI